MALTLLEAPARGTAYRFETSDEQAIRDRIAATLKQWQASGPVKVGATELVALERVGAHAIGCSVHDLRGCERDWIVTQAEQLAGL